MTTRLRPVHTVLAVVILGSFLAGVRVRCGSLGVFPYRDGPGLVAAILAAGWRARPPLRFPALAGQHGGGPAPRGLSGRPRAGPSPAVSAGGRVVEGVLGELFLRLVLAATLPPDRAARAAAGWAGDRSVAWAAGGRTCLRTMVVMDNAGEATELAAGLRRWAVEHARRFGGPGRRPPGGGHVTRCA